MAIGRTLPRRGGARPGTETFLDPSRRPSRVPLRCLDKETNGGGLAPGPSRNRSGWYCAVSWHPCKLLVTASNYVPRALQEVLVRACA